MPSVGDYYLGLNIVEFCICYAGLNGNKTMFLAHEQMSLFFFI